MHEIGLRADRCPAQPTNGVLKNLVADVSVALPGPAFGMKTFHLSIKCVFVVIASGDVSHAAVLVDQHVADALRDLPLNVLQPERLLALTSR